MHPIPDHHHPTKFKAIGLLRVLWLGSMGYEWAYDRWVLPKTAVLAPLGEFGVRENLGGRI